MIEKTKPAFTKAEIVQPLVMYDGPQLALLKGPRKVRVVAVAVDRDDMEYPFFACEVYKRDWQRYLSGKSDLYRLFAIAPFGSYYFFDWNSQDDKGQVKLKRAQKDEIENPEYWPDRGFFATGHTEETEEDVKFAEGSQSFKIDGTWETVDFSSLNGKLADLYAIFYAQQQFSDASISPVIQKRLASSIQSKLWRGGGSYTGFYKGLSNDIPGMPQFQVAGIQWHSPGQIDFRGDSGVFDEMLKSFSISSADFETAKKAHNNVDDILKREQLKTAKPNTPFSNTASENSAKKHSDTILKSLGITDPNRFFLSCGKNVLIYAKFALSLFRRFRGIYNYLAEGRLQLD